MDALEFLQSKGSIQPIYALFGQERFLKRQALGHIQRLVLGESGEDFGRTVVEGDSADLADVRDELQTLPFFGGRRLVIVQDADGFVSRYREALESYFQHPSSTGVLVLDVKTWKSNTRLAKMLSDAGTVACQLPERNTAAWVRSWLSKWAPSQHGKKVAPQALDLLIDLVGFDLGVLDQELAKLAVYVGDAPAIPVEAVDRLVGASREANVWRIFEALAWGRKVEAFATLESLLDQGQEPVAILGAMSWQLRRLAQVARLRQQGLPLQAAVSRAGLFRVDQVERLLRHLGDSAVRLYDWLLEADLGLKSSGQASPRFILERLMIHLAEPHIRDLAPAPAR